MGNLTQPSNNDSRLKLDSRVISLNFTEKTANFAVLVRWAAKNMLDFTQNLMDSRANLLPASQNNRRGLKFEKIKQ